MFYDTIESSIEPPNVSDRRKLSRKIQYYIRGVSEESFDDSKFFSIFLFFIEFQTL